jgi:transposase
VIIDHTNRRVLEVLENREKATVLAYLRREKESGLLASLQEVTTDMWDGYVEAVREAFDGTVAITIDRFHVMKNFQERLDQARRDIQRGLSEPEQAQLKGSRWLWLTNPENLTEEKRAQLDELKERYPSLRQLVEQRETLQGIFDNPRLKTPQQGQKRLQDWIKKVRRLGLKALESFCKTLENWLEKIANYFRQRSSNGPTEGFNRGLRAILWRACGIRNFSHFRLRVLDAFGRPNR